MANLNGMGPNNNGPLTGRGQGNCSPTSNTGRKIGLGVGMGMGMKLALGLRRGMHKQGFRQNAFRIGGRNNFRFQDSQQSMEDYKNFLEEELELIKNQKDTDHN